MELFVSYDGKNVMRWFGPNISGSDPVGELTDEQAVKVAEDIFIGLKLRGVSVDTLNFAIEEDALLKLEQAIEIVIELARENILTEGDARDNGLEDERNKQFDACGVVEDFAVNILAEERVNFPEDE